MGKQKYLPVLYLLTYMWLSTIQTYSLLPRECSSGFPLHRCRDTKCFVLLLTILSTVIPRLTMIIRSGITFVSRNVMLSGVSLLALSNVNNPVGLVGLPYVMWSAHFFVTHIQTEKISSWNGPTVHVCCFMLARAYTKTFVSRIHIR